MNTVPTEDGHADFTAEGRQLVGGGGTIDVARGEQRALALLFKHVGEFNGRRGLTGT
mgnify:CR=1 FL=1